MAGFLEMTEEQLSNLQVGDIVKHVNSDKSYVVTANYGKRVTAVSTVDICNPIEWITVKKADVDSVSFISERKNMDKNHALTIWKVYSLHGLEEFNNWLTLKRDRLKREEVVEALTYKEVLNNAHETIKVYKDKIAEIEQLIKENQEKEPANCQYTLETLLPLGKEFVYINNDTNAYPFSKIGIDDVIVKCYRWGYKQLAEYCTWATGPYAGKPVDYNKNK